MARKTSHLNKIKIQPTGPLADMIGSKPVSRPEATKKIWAHIKKTGLQGESGDGQTVTYNGRTYKGGQVIHCGECPMMKKFCGGKNKVAMVQLAKFTEKHSKSA